MVSWLQQCSAVQGRGDQSQQRGVPDGSEQNTYALRWCEATIMTTDSAVCLWLMLL